jgi:hypothetical protein
VHQDQVTVRRLSCCIRGHCVHSLHAAAQLVLCMIFWRGCGEGEGSNGRVLCGGGEGVWSLLGRGEERVLL